MAGIVGIVGNNSFLVFNRGICIPALLACYCDFLVQLIYSWHSFLFSLTGCKLLLMCSCVLFWNHSLMHYIPVQPLLLQHYWFYILHSKLIVGWLGLDFVSLVFSSVCQWNSKSSCCTQWHQASYLSWYMPDSVHNNNEVASLNQVCLIQWDIIERAYHLNSSNLTLQVKRIIPRVPLLKKRIL